VGSEPLHDLEAEPGIVRLNRLVEEGLAGLHYTGVSVNLLTLRPEICTLLLVRDPGWLASESVAAQRDGRPWRLAWEWLARSDEHQLPSGRSHHQFLALDDQLRPVSSEDSALSPAALIPNAAAAIALALPVARRLLGERTEAG
jgi:hypothetical protein